MHKYFFSKVENIGRILISTVLGTFLATSEVCHKELNVIFKKEQSNAYGDRLSCEKLEVNNVGLWNCVMRWTLLLMILVLLDSLFILLFSMILSEFSSLYKWFYLVWCALYSLSKHFPFALQFYTPLPSILINIFTKFCSDSLKTASNLSHSTQFFASQAFTLHISLKSC